MPTETPPTRDHRVEAALIATLEAQRAVLHRLLARVDARLSDPAPATWPEVAREISLLDNLRYPMMGAFPDDHPERPDDVPL